MASKAALETSIKTAIVSDFDHFARLIKNGTVENFKLHEGAFQATIDVILTPHLIVSRFEQSSGFFQKGFAAPGYISFLTWEPGVFFNWRNHTLRRGMLPVVWGIEHVALIGDGFRGYPISIREEFFN
jgi:hypothetical protein